MQSQSTTARQLRASLVNTTCLLVGGWTPQQIAENVAAHRNSEILKILNVIGADHEASPDATVWRDAFCHECETNEPFLGDARRFAEFLFDRGWIGEPKFLNVYCPKCEVS